jgi:ribosomal-protein-serine acetyltransferase
MERNEIAMDLNSGIYLAPIQKSDQEALFQAINKNRKFLEKWLPFICTITTAKDLIPFINQVTDSDNHLREPVFLIKEKKCVIGLIGFKERNQDLGQAEIGYWMVENKTGQGIMTRALNNLLLLAFQEIGLEQILIKCGAENLPSRKLPEKLGFKVIKVEPKGELMSNGEWIDLVHYHLQKAEYLGYNFQNRVCF